jgi:hypothetical protein
MDSRDPRDPSDPSDSRDELQASFETGTAGELEKLGVNLYNPAQLDQTILDAYEVKDFAASTLVKWGRESQELKSTAATLSRIHRLTKVRPHSRRKALTQCPGRIVSFALLGDCAEGGVADEARAARGSAPYAPARDCCPAALHVACGVVQRGRGCPRRGAPPRPARPIVHARLDAARPSSPTRAPPKARVSHHHNPAAAAVD